MFMKEYRNKVAFTYILFKDKLFLQNKYLNI